MARRNDQRRTDAAIATHLSWEHSGARDRGGRVVAGRGGLHEPTKTGRRRGDRRSAKRQLRGGSWD
jgi:hypothetical protein